MSTPNIGFTLIVEGQNQAEVSINDVINIIDALLMGRILDRTLSAPPGSPAEGDVYLIAASPTGLWTGQTGKIAVYFSGWMFLTPKEGWNFWINNEDVRITYNGSVWSLSGSGGGGSVAITYASTTQTPNASYGSNNMATLNTATTTIAAPSGVPQDGQFLDLRFLVDATGGRALSWNAIFAFGTDVAAADCPTTANAAFQIGFKYHSTSSKWRAVSIARGF